MGDSTTSYSVMMKLFSLNLLLPSLILSEEIEVRIPRTCKTTSGDACRFPFKFQGKTYYKCTYASSPTPWCATMVDRSGVVVTNRWGDCDFGSRFSSCDSRSSTTCITSGGPRPNRPCVFPFRYNGKTYSTCTDITIGRYWCSTATRSDGTHITGRYGLCPSTCPSTRSCRTISGPARGKACSFPFRFRGRSYNGCIRWNFGGPNQGRLWCSTRTDAQGNHISGRGNYRFCSSNCPREVGARTTNVTEGNSPS